MSTFGCTVVKIDSVDHHPNADRLSLVRIGGYTCISAKLEDGSHRYAPDDWVVYVPEAAVLPEWMLKKMGFWKEGKGTLNGSHGDRVKAVKLRDIVSQGVLYPVGWDDELAMKGGGSIVVRDDDRAIQVELGEDVSEFLGIVKYEPPIPVHMAGEITGLHGKTLKFDVENWQRYPTLFVKGEPVVATEKLHGTFAAFCYWPGLNHGELFNREWFAYSKGLGAQGLVFKHNERNAGNLYQRQLVRSGVTDKVAEHFKKVWSAERMNAFSYSKDWPITILGEIFGRGVQDLQYGQAAPTFRVFDVFVGEPGEGFYLGWDELTAWCQQIGLEMVPTLYQGPYDEAALIAVRDGRDTISGANIREGIVIKPQIERRTNEIGRAMLKMVSPNYLLRKGDATEYQ
jgi:RNA ligase (TIGR02306 family)